MIPQLLSNAMAEEVITISNSTINMAKNQHLKIKT